MQTVQLLLVHRVEGTTGNNVLCEFVLMGTTIAIVKYIVIHE